MAVSNEKRKKDPNWTKTTVPNLVRYEPSGVYFYRVRVKGKLEKKSLNTDVFSTAKLRLADKIKELRKGADILQASSQGKLLMQTAIDQYLTRVHSNPNLKPKTKAYYDERVVALKKSWPGIEKREVRKITATECREWAAKFAQETCATAFNNTISVLKETLDIAIEAGTRYDNPAAELERVSVRPKELKLPESGQFNQMVAAMENAGGRDSKRCADLARFLAYGGCRLSEARNVTWQDCDLAAKKIHIRGDAETGTKNWTTRQIPMIPEMEALLKKLRQQRPDETPETGVLQVWECQKSMDRAAKKVGMARITHHDLRHLFATRCIEAGVDIPTVSRWLGHKDGGALAMKTYGHLRDEHSQNMAKKVTFGSVPPKEPKPAELPNGPITDCAIPSLHTI